MATSANFSEAKWPAGNAESLPTLDHVSKTPNQHALTVNRHTLPTGPNCPERKTQRKINGIVAEKNISAQEARQVANSYCDN